MKECSHKNIDRGIKFNGHYFSFCRDCGKQWLDNGKQWEANQKTAAETAV